MMAAMIEMSGERVLHCDAEGSIIDSSQRAVDLIGEAIAGSASMIALPASRLNATFFELRSGIAGEIVQKIANYRLKLAIIGDISEPLAASSALRDWVRECNRRNEVWFQPSIDALAARLGKSRGSSNRPPPADAQS
jgi:hypothetical protein